MRVLMLLHDAFGGHGGIAKFNRDLLAALAAEPSIAQIVAVPRYMPLARGPIPDKLVFDTRALGGKLAYLARCLAWWGTGGRFDIVVCGHVNLLPFAWLWRVRTAGPLILVMHGSEIWQPVAGRLARYLSPRADAYIAVSRLTGERFRAWSKVAPARIHILPNCVEAARFGPGPKDPALVARYRLDGKRVIMTLGRLDARQRSKGIDAVLEALPELIAADARIVYLIAGDGDDRARLEEKARALGVAGHVVFTGLVEEAAKADHYRLADLYVMPSRGEGFGIVFLEALACGLPVIASRIDGGREALMDGRLGALVDPADRAALIAAIRDGLAKPKGTVPAELEQYAPAAFRRRLGAILDAVLRPGQDEAARDPGQGVS